jgi:SAM-dependent methyltransferase
MKEIWEKRYSNPEYAYGELPNIYLESQLNNLEPGKILFPADGEGRNSVYAATLGWEVSCFDQSIEAKKKALALAEKIGVEIDYQVGEIKSLTYKENQFDAIALIYAHFSAEQKSACHKILNSFLKIGGLIIFEAFSKKHIEYRLTDEKIGGPSDINTLFSLEEIKADFNNYEFLELKEEEVRLDEGTYHVGVGSVIRFVGKKLF